MPFLKYAKPGRRAHIKCAAKSSILAAASALFARVGALVSNISDLSKVTKSVTVPFWLNEHFRGIRGSIFVATNFFLICSALALVTIL